MRSITWCTSADGTGGLKKYPWPIWHPCASSQFICSLVSTPSATTVIFRALHGDDGLRQLSRVRILQHAAGKGLVYFEALQRQLAQVAQRRKSGAEIVERGGNTRLVQRAQDIPGLAEFAHEARFRHLDFQRARRYLVMKTCGATVGSGAIRCAAACRCFLQRILWTLPSDRRPGASPPSGMAEAQELLVSSRQALAFEIHQTGDNP
jgi:hypothetical protein